MITPNGWAPRIAARFLIGTQLGRAEGCRRPTPHTKQPVGATEPVRPPSPHAVAVNGSRDQFLARVGPFDPEGRSVNLMPPSGWGEGTHTIRTAGIVADLAGNMADGPDTTFTVAGSFALVSALPVRFGVDVDTSNRPLTAAVNKVIDPTTLTAVRLRENGVVVAATVSHEHGNLRVVPAVALKPSTRYTVDLTGVKAMDGQTIANPLDWTFSTAAELTAQAVSAAPSRRTAR